MHVSVCNTYYYTVCVIYLSKVGVIILISQKKLSLRVDNVIFPRSLNQYLLELRLESVSLIFIFIFYF